MADEAKKKGGGSSLLLWLLVLALFAVVLWLASERNARKWFLTIDGGQLVVARGRNFPTGTRNITAGDPELGKAYAPINVPAGAKPSEGEFDDQTALDRALFEQLLPWAKAAAEKNDSSSQSSAMALAERASQLPGLSAAQHDKLGALRGDLSFSAALGEVLLAAGQLESARRMLEQARINGGRHATQAATLAAELRAMADRLGDVAGGRAVAIAPSTPWETPVAPPTVAPVMVPADAGTSDAGR